MHCVVCMVQLLTLLNDVLMQCISFFVADCEKLSPTSRYYLYGSPFTCMVAVRLRITDCVLDVLYLHILYLTGVLHSPKIYFASNSAVVDSFL